MNCVDREDSTSVTYLWSFQLKNYYVFQTHLSFSILHFLETIRKNVGSSLWSMPLYSITKLSWGNFMLLPPEDYAMRR